MIHPTAGAVARMMGAMSPGAHAPALLALLYLPAAVIAAMVGIDLAARARVGPALAFLRRYRQAAARHKLLAVLLLAVAAIHAGLVPGHAAVDPVRSVAFAFDATALVLLAVWALVATGWQPATAVLLLVNIAGYAGYVAAGLEVLEPIGVASKLLEGAALAVIAWTELPRMRGRLRPRGVSS